MSALAVAAAIGGALAGCHPTGSPVVDAVEAAAFAATVTVICSRSSRGTWLVLAVATVALARGRLLAPALLTLAMAFASVFGRRAYRRAGALVGALGAQVVLRWPPQLFHGMPALAATIVVAFCGVSAYRRSSGQVRRVARRLTVGLGIITVILVVPVALSAVVVRSDLTRGQGAARLALDDVSGGRADLAAIELRAAAADLGKVTATSGAWWTAGARLVPVLAQNTRLISGAAQVTAAVASVGANEAQLLRFRKLRYHDGRVDLQALRALAGPANVLDHRLLLAERQLSGLDSAWLVGPARRPFDRLRASLEQTESSAGLVVRASTALPALLGATGPRHYLVAFMTPSESRGLDGFIGAYGELTAAVGHVTLSRSGSVEDLERALPGGGITLTGPADFVARYGIFRPGRYPQDATYSPDLPTVTAVLAQIYPRTGGMPIDGVLAIDPYGLAAILKFTGPIEVPGLLVPLTTRNAAQVLLSQQYTTFDSGITSQEAARHDFLQRILHLAFAKLAAGNLPDPRALSAALWKPVAQGRLAFWSTHASEQPLLRRLRVDGSFPRAAGGDLLAVTTQNAGNNKIDAYLHTAISDVVTVDPGSGSLASQLTISLRNDAGRTGLPPVVIDSPASPDLAPGTNRTWVTVYSPLAVGRVSIDGHGASVASGVEFGVHAYSTYVDVPASGRAVIRLGLTGRVSMADGYHLRLRLQPAANPLGIRVKVKTTGDWLVAGTSRSTRDWNPGPDSRQLLSVSFVPLPGGF